MDGSELSDETILKNLCVKLTEEISRQKKTISDLTQKLKEYEDSS